MEGLSNLGAQYHSTEPSRLVRAAEWQSESKAWSAMGIRLILCLLLPARPSWRSGAAIPGNPRESRAGGLSNARPPATCSWGAHSLHRPVRYASTSGGASVSVASTGASSGGSGAASSNRARTASGRKRVSCAYE